MRQSRVRGDERDSHNDDRHGRLAGPAGDMWGLGCIAYMVLCESHPFDPTGTGSDLETLRHIVEGELDTSGDQWNELSDPAKDLIMGLLDPDPSKRLDANAVLAHPWMRG